MSTTQERLDAYLAAELQVLKGQAVRFGDRQLTRADLAEITRTIRSLEAKLAQEKRGAQGGYLRGHTATFCGKRE